MMEQHTGEHFIFQGRESLLSHIATLLTQMNRNNVFLIGDSGVGSTALIRQLEKQCHFGKCRIFDIEKALLTPNNLLTILERKPQAEANEKLIIALDGLNGLLTADETIRVQLIHWIRQVIIEKHCQLVLVCSRLCYQRFFATDQQLTSRCQTIELKTPNFTTAVVMVNAHLDEVCRYYNVTIADGVIPAVVALTHRYVHDVMLPGSALNLLDTSIANLKQKDSRTVLELQDVLEIVSQWTNIPADYLLISDEEKLRHCASKLSQQIYGQEQALTIIARTLQAGFLKLHSTKAMGIMVFSGPKGVGKMSTAIALAKLFYGNEHYLLRFNMSQYQKPLDLKCLLGDGLNEGLLAKLRQYPAAVYVFEHIDLAHPQVIAELSDSFIHGELARFDLSHAIVIMTAEKEWNYPITKKTTATKSPPQKEQLLQLVVDDLPGMNVSNDVAKEDEVEERQIDTSKIPEHFSETFYEDMTIVPFHHLQPSALECLISSELDCLKQSLKEDRQIHLNYPSNLARELLSYLPKEKCSVAHVKQILSEKILSAVSQTILSAQSSLQEISLKLEKNACIVC